MSEFFKKKSINSDFNSFFATTQKEKKKKKPFTQIHHKPKNAFLRNK